jgi:HD-GYP domain-containing protein (c-di-GMP phosphodiesterase class II)
MSVATEAVMTLGAARRAVQLYPPSHPAYGEAIDALVDAIAAATTQGPFSLNLHLGRLYDGSIVIPEDVHGIDSVATAFEERGIESLTFQPGFSAADATGLTDVLSIKPSPELDVEAELASRGVRGVLCTFLASTDEDEVDAVERVRTSDRALHSRLLSNVRTLAQQVSEGGGADLSHTTPLVEALLGRMLEDRAAVMGLATIRSDQERVLFHSLSVMIYTLALGQRLDLPEDGLVKLATAALLHDIGKTAFDADDPAQAEAMRTLHPRVGAQILLTFALDDPSPLLVAYEHHMNVDGSGFPGRPADYIAHPYSRMVAIADRFENLVNAPAPANSLTPDRAVVDVLRSAGTSVDPFFARVFAGALGVFPIGCLVRLSDQSVGVVAALGEDPLAPVARIVYDERGLEPEERTEVDLSEGFVRIVEIVSPDALGLEISDLL